jgi:hypothetical protein
MKKLLALMIVAYAALGLNSLFAGEMAASSSDNGLFTRDEIREHLKQYKPLAGKYLGDLTKMHEAYIIAFGYLNNPEAIRGQKHRDPFRFNVKAKKTAMAILHEGWGWNGLDEKRTASPNDAFAAFQVIRKLIGQFPTQESSDDFPQYEGHLKKTPKSTDSTAVQNHLTLMNNLVDAAYTARVSRSNSPVKIFTSEQKQIFRIWETLTERADGWGLEEKAELEGIENAKKRYLEKYLAVRSEDEITELSNGYDEINKPRVQRLKNDLALANPEFISRLIVNAAQHENMSVRLLLIEAEKRRQATARETPGYHTTGSTSDPTNSSAGTASISTLPPQGGPGTTQHPEAAGQAEAPAQARLAAAREAAARAEEARQAAERARQGEAAAAEARQAAAEQQARQAAATRAEEARRQADVPPPAVGKPIATASGNSDIDIIRKLRDSPFNQAIHGLNEVETSEGKWLDVNTGMRFLPKENDGTPTGDGISIDPKNLIEGIDLGKIYITKDGQSIFCIYNGKAILLLAPRKRVAVTDDD